MLTSIATKSGILLFVIGCFTGLLSLIAFIISFLGLTRSNTDHNDGLVILFFFILSLVMGVISIISLIATRLL